MNDMVLEEMSAANYSTGRLDEAAFLVFKGFSFYRTEGSGKFLNFFFEDSSALIEAVRDFYSPGNQCRLVIQTYRELMSFSKNERIKK